MFLVRLKVKGQILANVLLLTCTFTNFLQWNWACRPVGQDRHESLWGNRLASDQLEDREGDGKVMLRWILGKYIVRTRSIWNLLRIASNAVSGVESEFCCRRNSSYVETQLVAVEAVVSFSRFAPVVKICRVRRTACWIYLGWPYVERRIGCWSPRNWRERVFGNNSLIHFKFWYHSIQPIFKCNRNLNGFIICSSESNLICALWNTCYNIQFTMPHDALSSALFFCDQRYTTEYEKIHLQQSQETSNVISERLVFIDIKKSLPPSRK
jgi:hypothetical protein